MTIDYMKNPAEKALPATNERGLSSQHAGSTTPLF
jgi:hypothetical protein